MLHAGLLNSKLFCVIARSVGRSRNLHEASGIMHGRGAPNMHISRIIAGHALRLAIINW